jgi:hypothetical protein
MSTEVLAAGNTPATSANVTVADGANAVFVLSGASGQVPGDAYAAVRCKTPLVASSPSRK